MVFGPSSRLTDSGRPEVAFAGRSNVGKSSLINGLMNRKSLARTSAVPGKTQTINFYNINDAMYLVDLPGYGYARVSQTEKERWGRLIERYLHSSKTLRAVFLLVDIRHAPSAADRQMYAWICAQGILPVVIATKLDKIKRSQKEACLRMIRRTLEMGEEDLLLPWSASDRTGREEIWKVIEEKTGLCKDPES